MAATAPRPRSTHRLACAALAAAASCTVVVMSAAPAAAAPSCAGTVFALQGRAGSGVVATRVHEIKREIIPVEEPEGTTFGHVISRRLAQVRCS